MNKIDLSNIGITKQDIEKYYISENHTKKEAAEYFHLSLFTLSNLFKYFNIKKDVKLQVEKRRETCLNKYGVDNPSKSPAIKSKIEETHLERYGATRFTKTDQGKDKIKETKLLRYGDSNYNNTNKNKETKQTRYGDPFYNNRSKNGITCMKRYGVINGGCLEVAKENHLDNIFKNKGYSPEFRSLISNREAAIAFLQTGPYTLHELAIRFNAKYWIIQSWITRLDLRKYIKKDYSGRSSYEDEIVDFLKSAGISHIERNNKKLISHQEIDIYLPDFNIGIEFNGIYWHDNNHKAEDYHFQKSMEAEKLGIHLIHIYEHEWRDSDKRPQVEDYLLRLCNKLPNNLTFLDCELKKVDTPQYIKYTLQHLDLEVMSITFVKKKLSKWVLSKIWVRESYDVQGGLPELLKIFLRDNQVNELIVCCDFNKYNGRVFEQSGMQSVGYTGPTPLKLNTQLCSRVLGAGYKIFKWYKRI